MKLKDLTVDLSGIDNIRNRSVNIGPFSDGLNFIYGERGTGKSTIRNLVADLLLDSCHLNAQYSASTGHTSSSRGSAGIVIECESGRFRISRDQFGKLETTRIGSGATRGSLEPVRPPMQLDRELTSVLSFVGFHPSAPTRETLYSTLHHRLRIPLGPEAASDQSNSQRIDQERVELQARIDAAQRELSELESNRSSHSLGSVSHNGELDADLNRRISDLTLRLSELDPNRVRIEIESLRQEATRLRAEIGNATVAVQAPAPSRYLPTLYRLLDEIDQQVREVRVVQSNVQRHRVRLKEEMEFLSGLTIDEQNHPYHRAREILHQIESRIDNADTRGGQWLDDHGTVDAKQVSNFIDQTCSSLRSDLQLLCDELSGQYREMHNRSAAMELKELRHNYSHMSELIQKMLARRETVLLEIHSIDPTGAEAIKRAEPEFCRIAASSGHLAARQQFLGALETQTSHVVRDTSLQQQQLAALESRLGSLQSSLAQSEVESGQIAREISELNARKSSLSMAWETERNENLARIDAQIHSLQASIGTLTLQRDGLVQRTIEPNPILLTAGGILQHLTRGQYTRVWLSAGKTSFEIQDRNSHVTSVDNANERGLSQLVQLSLVLAANESKTTLDAPLIFDDLFADLPKECVDPTLETLARWCRQTQIQIILLTRHRFLADRLADAPLWEIATEPRAQAWESKNGTIRSSSTVSETRLNTTQMSATPTRVPPMESWQQEVYVGMPVAEYPYSPMSRPYPLSKYPRTTDRKRMSGPSTFEYVQPEVQIETSAVYSTGVVEVDTHRTTTISPAIIGDRYQPPSITNATLIETVALFDSAQFRCLASSGIGNVGNFLLLDPQTEDSNFTSCYLAGQSLEHLQAAVWLMCWIPGLSANHAQALVACGISDPEHLLTSNVDSMFERVSRFLRSPDGRRFSSEGQTPSRETVGTWQLRLRNNREYRHQRRPRPSRAQRSHSDRHVLRAFSPNEFAESVQEDGRHQGEGRQQDERRQRDERAYADRTQQRRIVSREAMPIRSPRMRTPETRTTESRNQHREASYAPREKRVSERKPAAVRQSAVRQSLSSLNESESPARSRKSRSKSKASSGAPKLRFYLDLADHIEAAPSIGPKTGARFEAIGVFTISDFLKMTAESLAEKLDYKRLNAKLLRQWQNQARLVCRIPNLRGHDAQLLVGCEIIEAEELASMRPETLFAKIAPFSDTKEGLKIIRNGKKPDLAEITDWISFAQHNRSLQAA